MSWKKKLATGTALAALTAGAVYIVNKYIYFMATLNDFLSKPKGNYYEWRFGKFFYTKKGSGSPILLVHDLTSASSGYEWNRIEETLSHTNTVYTIDLLGCGRSDKPNITYTNFLYVQLVTDFIKHIIGKRTDVITTGYSSSFVLAACANDTNIINKLILTNPSDLSEIAKIPTKRTKALKALLNTPLVGTLLYNVLMIRKNIETLFQTNYFYNSDEIMSQYVNVYYEAAHTCNSKPKYLFSSMKGRFTNFNMTHCLKLINNSIFIITGNGNPENLVSAQCYKEHIPSIEIVPMNKTNHLPQIEDPNAYLEHIKILFEIEE
ncbi:MAG: alpha/beta fold hydrolase [Lachnospiraceae bacterium]